MGVLHPGVKNVTQAGGLRYEVYLAAKGNETAR